MKKLEEIKTIDDLKSYIDGRLNYFDDLIVGLKKTVNNKNMTNPERKEAEMEYLLRVGMSSEARTIKALLEMITNNEKSSEHLTAV